MDGSHSAATSTRGDADLRRYRRAAADALQQIDWCIGYLYAIRKRDVARALARNRSTIHSEL